MKFTEADLANLGQHTADKRYSQTGEDGVLVHLFKCLGIASGYLVDLGAGDGWSYSNVRALVNTGWSGVLIDAACFLGVAQEKITDENVVAVLDKYHVPAEFDLLALDIDGQDWWVWKALDRRPKIIVVEVNNNIPADPAVTVPRYPPWVHDGTTYYGASFSAFVQLGYVKGYTLVYNCGGINLFFVRNDLLEPGYLIMVPFEQRVGHPPDEQNREWHTVVAEDFVEVPGRAPMHAEAP
jgi:hypothetical protein